MSVSDVTLQIELDSAWEAYRQMKQLHDVAEAGRDALAKNRQRDYPIMEAFEEIASMAGYSHMPDALAAAKLQQIRDVIERARQRSEDIAQRQAKRKT